MSIAQQRLIPIHRSNTCPEHPTLLDEPFTIPIASKELTSSTQPYISDRPADGNQVSTATERPPPSWIHRSRHWIGEVIESKRANIVFFVLTIIDIIIVILQIGASLIHHDHAGEETTTEEVFSHISLAIISVFVLEISLKLYAFGPRYFSTNTRHGLLHLIDAVIIIATFALEIILHGTAEELSSLLVLFRLWRVIKLASTVAIEVSEHDEARVVSLETKIRLLERDLEANRLKVQRLERFSDTHG